MWVRIGNDGSKRQETSLRYFIKDSWDTFLKRARDRSSPLPLPLQPFNLRSCGDRLASRLLVEHSPSVFLALVSTATKRLKRGAGYVLELFYGFGEFQEGFLSQLAYSAYSFLSGGHLDDYAGLYTHIPGADSSILTTSVTMPAANTRKVYKTTILNFIQCMEVFVSTLRDGLSGKAPPPFQLPKEVEASAPHLLNEWQIKIHIMQAFVFYFDCVSNPMMDELEQRTKTFVCIQGLLECGCLEEAMVIGGLLAVYICKDAVFSWYEWTCDEAEVKQESIVFRQEAAQSLDYMFAIAGALMSLRNRGLSLRCISPKRYLSREVEQCEPFSGALQALLDEQGVALCLDGGGSTAFLATGEMVFLPVSGSVTLINEDVFCLTAVMREPCSGVTLVVRMSQNHPMDLCLQYALKVLYERVREDLIPRFKKALRCLEGALDSARFLAEEGPSSRSLCAAFVLSCSSRISHFLPFTDDFPQEAATVEGGDPVAEAAKLRMQLDRALKALKALSDDDLEVEMRLFGLGLVDNVFPPEKPFADCLSALMGIVHDQGRSDTARELAGGCAQSFIQLSVVDEFCRQNARRVVVTAAALGGIKGESVLLPWGAANRSTLTRLLMPLRSTLARLIPDACNPDAVNPAASNPEAVNTAAYNPGAVNPAEVSAAQPVLGYHTVQKNVNLLHLQVFSVHNEVSELVVRPIVPIRSVGCPGTKRAVLSQARILCNPVAGLQSMTEVTYRSLCSGDAPILFGVEAIKWLRGLSGSSLHDVRVRNFMSANRRPCFFGDGFAEEPDMGEFAVLAAFEEYVNCWSALLYDIVAYVKELECSSEVQEAILNAIEDLLGTHCPLYLGPGSEEANRALLYEKFVALLPQCVEALEVIPFAEDEPAIEMRYACPECYSAVLKAFRGRFIESLQSDPCLNSGIEPGSCLSFPNGFGIDKDEEESVAPCASSGSAAASQGRDGAVGDGVNGPAEDCCFYVRDCVSVVTRGVQQLSHAIEQCEQRCK